MATHKLLAVNSTVGHLIGQSSQKVEKKYQIILRNEFVHGGCHTGFKYFGNTYGVHQEISVPL